MRKGSVTGSILTKHQLGPGIGCRGNRSEEMGTGFRQDKIRKREGRGSRKEVIDGGRDRLLKLVR